MHNTDIFLIRHAKKSNSILFPDSCGLMEIDEKRPLSALGQYQAKKISLLPCLKNLDAVYSSHFVRSISTAIYTSELNCCPINISKAFGERIRQESNSAIIPESFRIKQFVDENYKLINGECRIEVFNRFQNGINEIITKYKGGKVAIFSHKTAITMYLMEWCECIIDDNIHLIYNKKTIMDGQWNGSPEIFHLVYDDFTIVNIEKIDNGLCC